MQHVLQKCSPNGSIPDVVPDVPLSSIANFSLEPVGSLFDVLPNPIQCVHPVTMKSLNQSHGFILYETTSDGS
ncbi:hypothetical protein V1522DRAFT_414700 [Lipomyces starkeyi]